MSLIIASHDFKSMENIMCHKTEKPLNVRGDSIQSNRTSDLAVCLFYSQSKKRIMSKVITNDLILINI